MGTEGWSRRREMQHQEEQDLRGWRGVSAKDVLHFFEGDDIVETVDAPDQNQEMIETEDTRDKNKKLVQSLFDGFLIDLRARGIRVSTPEWMHFLTVVKERMREEHLKTAMNVREIFERLRVYARVTLVKNKQDEATFNEAFDQYFLSIAKVVEDAVAEEDKKAESISIDMEEIAESQEEEKEEIESEKPEIKEQLGITEVDENLTLPEDDEHDDNEQVHGGNKDQHNDILKKQDKSKKGGSDNKEEEEKEEGGKEEKESGKTGKKDDKEEHEDNEQVHGGDDLHGEVYREDLQELGQLAGGKGKSVETLAAPQRESLSLIAQQRAKHMERHDGRNKYERRPERADIRQIIRNLRRIILNTSQTRSGKVDIRGTVERFARKNFGIDYKHEREKQPEIVLFIDVGGPVDEWSPLIREVAEEMTKGLTKLEVYLFHNNLYGYVWELDPKNPRASNHAKPDSLVDVKSIVKRKKKVIIYGDAEMSATEFRQDQWEPYGNEKRVKKFGMAGDECLRWITQKADSAVWINPIFEKEWGERDDSGTITATQRMMPMYDLSVGGVQDAIKELIKR